MLFCLGVPIGLAWWLGVHEEHLEFDRAFMAVFGWVRHIVWEGVAIQGGEGRLRLLHAQLCTSKGARSAG